MADVNAATLFSGIGAPEVAMPSWDWRWHAEIEKFPSAVMAARHPLSVNLGDVTANDFCELALSAGRPDVLVFGSPCQSFSVAGRRLGLDDPRGNLALVALGIIARLEPVWFVFENVPGLLSASDGRDFGLFLRAVDELGYHVAWTVLDAQYAGLAQRRERVFAVGHARDWRYPAAVLFEPESLSGHPPARGEAREDVAGTLASRTSAGGGVSHCLNAGGMGRIDYESETLITHALDSPTLRSGGHDRSHANGGVMPAVAFAELADPIAANQGRTYTREGRNNFRVSNVAIQSGVRRLMPVECERLQGFPDDYTLIDYRGQPAKDGPRYKAIGNSMAVPVVRCILERIDWLHCWDLTSVSPSRSRP